MRLLCIPLLLLATSMTGERPGGFRVIGPGGGGAMYHPTISPHDPNTVLVSCDMTGAYLTRDAGRSWRMFNLRGTVRFFAFDPQNSTTIYAGTTGLWRSRNSGDTWDLIWPKPENVRGVRMNSDHADETIVTDSDPLGELRALAVDPKDSNLLFAASKSAVWVSHDAGGSWTQETALPEAPRHLWVTPNGIYAGGLQGVSVRIKDAWQRRPAPQGVLFNDITLGFSSQGPAILYATSAQGAYVSSDGGATWTNCPLPGTGARVQALATSLHHPDTAYLSYSRLMLDGQRWLGVARTEDRGKTWQLVWKEAKSASPTVRDAWITPSFGPDWGENPLDLGIDDQDPKLVYATDLGRTMRTTDGGATWDGVYSRRVANAGWTSTGLDVTNSYGLHFDPHHPHRQFITYTDIGLFRSEDHGLSWQPSTTGVPRAWTNTTYWIEFDPSVPDRLWGAMSGTHDLPRPKMWRRRSVQTYKGGICRSEDGGRTWRKCNEGMPETAPTHLLLDPTSSPGKRVLYAATMGHGVYKSTDDGVTWTAQNQGILQTEPLAWRLSRAGDGTLYVLIARRSEDGSIGTSGDGALYRSTDGAETWTAVPLPAGANAPNGLAIDPNDSRRLYLATWARAKGMHGEGGGIWLSTDAGATWRAVLDRDQHVYDVTIDPRQPDHLDAAGFESAAWRSTDRGEHWTRIPGFNFKWGHRVIPDPADSAKVYITTFGGSVWHGAVDGKPGPEDIATPVLQPGR